jgi:hypothetical protein
MCAVPIVSRAASLHDESAEGVVVVEQDGNDVELLLVAEGRVDVELLLMVHVRVEQGLMILVRVAATARHQEVVVVEVERVAARRRQLTVEAGEEVTTVDAGKEAPPVRFDGELDTAMLWREDAMVGGTVVAPWW